MQPTLFPTHSLPPFARGLMTVTMLVLAWEMRHRTRKGLRGLDDRLLKDIGLAPDAADAERSKPFWQA